MTLRTLTGCAACMGLLFVLAVFPSAVSQENYDSGPPTLYFRVNDNDGEPTLIFLSPDDNYYSQTVDLGSDENIIFSIHGIEDRIYSPDIVTELTLDLSQGTGFYYNYYLDFQMRCDGDGDGIFEYVVDFPSANPDYYGIEVEASSFEGEAINMSHGTIEFEIRRNDTSSSTISLECTSYSTYLQVPFDLDADGDGIGDYSDPDDDNDGHPDYDDAFPRDQSEWKDSDHDGIGDNADDDDNDNGIPDAFELPLAMCIVLIPFAIILAFMKRMKKSKGGKGEDEKATMVTKGRSAPKNW